ncbi:MAG: gluconate 5-dehydrogenase, partial [Verrucomicrobiae bacterium]|nr:gluconate 5-dehydrogenase [Verrucomicrobiae bacterium]
MKPTSDPFDLTGKNIWVLGGAGYLGQAVVGLRAARNAHVRCAGLADKAATFVARQGLGDIVQPASLDVANTEMVSRFVAEHASAGVPHGLVVMTYAST